MKILTETLSFDPTYRIGTIAPEEEVLFFDIETTGLRKETTQVYLIGCAFFDGGEWKLRQYLAESALDEQEIMEQFCEFAGSFRTLIHFNGDGFDIPYLAYKAQFYDLDFDFQKLRSVDIYKLAKPLKKFLCLESLSQKSVERFLKIGRDDEYGGGALIPVFYDYERTGDPKAEHLLLLHNFDDVQGMLKIVDILSYLDLLEGDFEFRNLEIVGDTAVFEYTLKMPVPVSFEKYLDRDRIVVFAGEDLLQISIRIFDGEAKHPLPDIENYYYLPAEDKVIHKDVAVFVDKDHRRKATKKNCYLKKKGRFLPQKHPLFEPVFQIDGEKMLYFELDGSVTEDHRMLTEYALDIIKL